MNILIVLDHDLKNYRIPLFEYLGQKGYKITIGHVGGKIEGDFSFDQLILKNHRIFLGEYRNLPSLKSYDVIIHMQNIRILNLWALSLNPFRNYKIIHWGIGVSSAKGLQKYPNKISKMRNFLSNFADSLIFYSEYPLFFFSEKNRQKSFIAHNTIFNSQAIDTSGEDKNSFLFIGTINERKGLDILLRSFKQYLEKGGTITKLNIVGSGNENMVQKLENYVFEESLSSYVFFQGPLYEDTEKLEYFSDAIACVSPKQAGLSVLESFSYGVPFICFEDAISGGEHLNVINDFNGYLVNSDTELTEKLFEISVDKNKAQMLGQNAYLHYTKERSMERMVEEFSKAIEYTLSK